MFHPEQKHKFLFQVFMMSYDFRSPFLSPIPQVFSYSSFSHVFFYATLPVSS